MAAVPVADPEVEARRPRTVISGKVSSAMLPPPGCGFHTRCLRAMAVCKVDELVLQQIARTAPWRFTWMRDECFPREEKRLAELPLSKGPRLKSVAWRQRKNREGARRERSITGYPERGSNRCEEAKSQSGLTATPRSDEVNYLYAVAAAYCCGGSTVTVHF
jgi:hypothetical protein